jgi:hypothetical protein
VAAVAWLLLVLVMVWRQRALLAALAWLLMEALTTLATTTV